MTQFKNNLWNACNEWTLFKEHFLKLDADNSHLNEKVDELNRLLSDQETLKQEIKSLKEELEKSKQKQRQGMPADPFTEELITDVTEFDSDDVEEIKNQIKKEEEMKTQFASLFGTKIPHSTRLLLDLLDSSIFIHNQKIEALEDSD